ncbi:hypothetical protein D5F01_LYC23710 [Larimichthys crocea]|uniref:Uncharacterized protein n=1 Tax=Larimichthys crocea TaxID=215358 RepID=A0A6G0HGA7_LARCR|nr:hypothetical protein D5F01_LYC23710 [Larimichthys crocea]
MDVTDLKAEILTTLEADIAMLIGSELKAAVADDFQNITAAIRSDVETMKATVLHMEQGLSSCSDDVSSLLTKVGKLEMERPTAQKPRRQTLGHRKVHYYQDCADILRCARESGQLRFNGTDISIFPDYPPSVVQARSAFGEHGSGSPIMELKKRFQNPGEAMAYVKAKILPDFLKD